MTFSGLLLLGQAEVAKDAGLGGNFFFVVVLGIAAIVGLFFLMAAIAFIKYGNLWFQVYMSSADVSMISLIGMGFRQVNSRVIVQGKIMATQAGLDINRATGISTQRLEGHYLAGGNVSNVILAIISAHRAGIPLDFDRAAAIDLAGRDVLDAVRTSVTPKIIDCPDARADKAVLSAVACNGIELLIKARVTVRTNLAQLIGGATEDTIVARVGQGIITSIAPRIVTRRCWRIPTRSREPCSSAVSTPKPPLRSSPSTLQPFKLGKTSVPACRPTPPRPIRGSPEPKPSSTAPRPSPWSKR